MFLEMGISLTEQGYDTLDHDLAVKLTTIAQEKAKWQAKQTPPTPIKPRRR